MADTPTLDLRVFIIAGFLTLLTTLGVGVLPSLRATRARADVLQEGSRAGVGGRRERLRAMLVVAAIAASTLLSISTGLLIRALWRLQATDPGFTAASVLTLRTSLPMPAYGPVARRERFYARVLAEVRAMPGVTDAAYISFLPMVFRGGIFPVVPEGEAPVDSQTRQASVRFVTPGFFDAMRIPLHRGRDVREADTFATGRVAVVSDSFAKRHWPNADPIGRRFLFLEEQRTVVGVVGDVRVRGPERESEPQVYVPYRQVADGWLPFYAPKDLAVRASGDPTLLLPSLRAIIRDADPEQPISNVRLMDEVVGAQTAPRRTQLHMIVAFAALAFLLAAIGIYGLLSFAVSNRVQEIGVRMAVGATPGSILRMVLREGLVLSAAGSVLGLGAAWAAGRSLEALLVGVTPTDAPTLAAVLVLVLVMTLAGSLVPAWRASRLDPATVIRSE